MPLPAGLKSRPTWVLSRSWSALWLCALSSALYVLGYAGFDLWPLSCVALVPLFWAIDRVASSGGHALLIGLGFGMLGQLAGASWLVATLRAFSGLPLGVCLAAFVLLCAYQGGQFALFAWLCHRVTRRGLPLVAFAPFCLGALEWVYPQLFPSPFAASLHAAPLLVQLAEIGGPILLGMLLTAVNAMAYTLLSSLLERRPPPRKLLWLLTALVAFVPAYGAVRIGQVDVALARAPSLTLGLVQANMGTWEKRRQRALGRRRHLEQSKALEHEARPDLLIWPETALAFPIARQTRSLAPWLAPLATPVLLGALTQRVHEGRAELYNSAFLADKDGRVLGRSDKLQLLPFGEYIPFGERFPRLYELVAGSGRLTPGEAPHALPFRRYRIAALICYEDLLEAHVREVVRRTDPHLLVDLSNDAWFGRSREPHIHLALAKLRAVEHRRYLVRAGNVGITSVVDPAGRVAAAIPPFARGNLVAKVALVSGQTPFARFGDLFGWLALAVSAWACVKPARAGGQAATSRDGSTAAGAA